jgi:glycosyltransferase involved in cell wall biosynthesis
VVVSSSDRSIVSTALNTTAAGLTRLKRGARPAAVTIAGPVMRAFGRPDDRRISAMVRVKNEEQFLRASIESIVDLVDEVVLIDNLSTDSTPAIIRDLAQRYPGKVRPFTYTHAVARYGSENEELASTRDGRRYPRLLKNFYNWALQQCRYPFIFKWDGDTVALDALAVRLAGFRTGDALALWHTGANLHEDGEHLIAGHPYEDMEPRLFYRRFARYTNEFKYCETLKSPYVQFYPDVNEYAAEPLYVHLKHCKSTRYDNMSDDLQRAAEALAAPGEPIDDDVRAAIERWHLLG